MGYLQSLALRSARGLNTNLISISSRMDVRYLARGFGLAHGTDMSKP